MRHAPGRRRRLRDCRTAPRVESPLDAPRQRTAAVVAGGSTRRVPGDRSVVTGTPYAANSEKEDLRVVHSHTWGGSIRRKKAKIAPPPLCWIGSAGCQADCEHLKRDLRADLRAARHFGEVETNGNNAVDTIAIALSQTLYARRGFPYYAFCVVAGIGRVFVYDAVGSYEQVAVACAGTGRDLLQPILDRTFRSVVAPAPKVVVGSASSAQTVGHIPSTQVDCETPERAVQLLLGAYRSVAEREIGVGDRVVFYTVQQKKRDDDGDENNNDNKCECKIWTAPLKKH